MDPVVTHQVLPVRQLRRFDHPLGLQLRCHSGCLWITADGDCRDHVCEAGESYAADTDRRLIVYALEDARFDVTARAGELQ